jgi:hypothetical protein
MTHVSRAPCIAGLRASKDHGADVVAFGFTRVGGVSFLQSFEALSKADSCDGSCL